MLRIRPFVFLWFILLLPVLVFSQVPKPEDVLGFQVGTDRKMADMRQIVDYFQQLDKASPRIQVKEVGKTTEGNPFIVAFITSENNHKYLEKYRLYQQKLADPRHLSDSEAERIIQEGKAIVMVNCSIHATEIGASQMSMQLAYDLATKTDPKINFILENVILLLVPMHNPDGIQMVAEWYKKNLDTPYEGGSMPWLYQKYVGHDNNRDWYMFTQKESQLTIKIHNAWHPQIVVDMHQMGNRGARLFVPPYVDPYEPNVDPIIRQQVAMMGTFIASELTAEGKGGVQHSSRFDAWTPARAYHHYHGGIRILTEAASVRIATPIKQSEKDLSPGMLEPTVKMPLPWKGGEWRLKDIVDYDYSAVRAALTNAASLRENWVRNFYRIHKKAVNWSGSPFAYIIPEGQINLPAAFKMMQVLNMGGVEIHRSEETFTADGNSYPEGSFIIFIAQPYGGYAKALLERQVYPEIREIPGGPLKTPYDVVGHTLPLLMGVDAILVENSFQAEIRLLEEIIKPEGLLEKGKDKFGFIWGHSTNDDIVALNRLLKKGYRVYWSAQEFEMDGLTYPPGTMIVRQKKGLADDLKAITKDLLVSFKGIEKKPEIQVYELNPVKLGLYKGWTASMDEGWTRWVLEQFEFPYQSVFDKDIRAGNLNRDFDVLLFPDVGEVTIVNGLSEKVIPKEYSGGIGQEGVDNILEFVKNGGTLITLNSAAGFPMKYLELDIKNSTRGLRRTKFYIPGSLLKALNNSNHPIAYGYDKEAALFFRRSPAFEVAEGVSVIEYPQQSLLSGWATGEEILSGLSALVDVPHEKGRVILIGFPVLYRGQAHGTFRFLFNAIHYGASQKGGF